LGYSGSSMTTSIVPLPGKRPWVVLAMFVMVGLSVWLAAAFVASPRLPAKLKLGIRGVPDVVDANLGILKRKRRRAGPNRGHPTGA
jgi:hypothetical protein